jgi:DNA polymerase
VDDPPEWVLPTTHPSAVLRSRNRDEDLAAFVADLKVAASAL